MFFPTIRRSVGAVALLIGATGIASAADDARTRIEPGRSAIPAAQRPGAARPGAARGTLPDPALLDGSTQPAEKRPEHGMIGDFELPGDENAKSGKVGGPQNPNQQGGGGQQGNPPAGLPQGGGAAGQQQSSQGQPPQQGGGGAQGGEQSAQSGGQQGGGAQAGGEQNQAGGNAGAGDPGAQAQGIQVSEIGGPQGAQQPGDAAGAAGEKPQAVAIGDKGMRIETTAPQAGVVGAQQVGGHTQQHEKGTGSGGKGTGGASGGNRVEKGRAIPAGL